MAIQNIPNQPLQISVEPYEICEDEIYTCALYRESDGDIYAQYKLIPCTPNLSGTYTYAASWTNTISPEGNQVFTHAVGVSDSFAFNSSWSSDIWWKFNFRVYGSTAGFVNFYFPTPTSIQSITENGIYTIYVYGSVTGADTFSFGASSDFDGAVEIISVDGYSYPDASCLKFYNFKGQLQSGITYDIKVLNDNFIISFDPSTFQKNCFYFTICDPCNPLNIYTSNCFQIVAYDDAQNTKLLIGDCTRFNKLDYEFNFYWNNFNPFQLKQRLISKKFAPIYQNDSKDYVFSDGSKKITSTQRSKFYDIVFCELNEVQHDTLSTQMLCRNFYIDGVEYFVQPDDYKPEWSKQTGYSKADVRMQGMKQGTIIFRDNQN